MIVVVHCHAWLYPEHFNALYAQHAWQVSEQLNQQFPSQLILQTHE